MHCRLTAKSISGFPVRCFPYLLLMLVFLCSPSSAMAGWQCSLGMGRGGVIYSKEYIQGSIEFTPYDKAIFRDITSKLGKRLNEKRPAAICSSNNICTFSSAFFSYLGVDKKYRPKFPEIVNICTYSSHCIAGFCSQHQTYQRVVFDWKGGFVDLTKTTSSRSEDITDDDLSEVNIPFTPDIIDIWARRVRVSKTESIVFSYTAIK